MGPKAKVIRLVLIKGVVIFLRSHHYPKLHAKTGDLLQLFFRSKQKGKSMAQDSCQMGTRAAPRARTRRARTLDPRPIALRVRSRPSQQRTHAHAPKSFSAKRKLTSAFTSAISLLLGASEFSRYDRALANVDRHPHAPAARTAKNARPAVQNARSMGRVDRHDVKVKSPERRRALARAEVRLRARRAAHEATCAVPLLALQPASQRAIATKSRAPRVLSQTFGGG